MKCLVLLLPALACYGQIRDLASTYDGNQLYFSTPQRLIGTEALNNSKIYRYLEGHFELFAYQPPRTGPNTYCCNYRSPEVSGDGRVVGYTSNASCFGGGVCYLFQWYSGVLRGTYEKGFSGQVRLSPDGRYVLQIPFGSYPYNSLFDNVSGVETPLLNRSQGVIGDGKQSIAIDGTVLLSDRNGAILWKAGAVKVLGLSAPKLARLSANGTIIVYQTAEADGTSRLISHEVASGRETVLSLLSTDSGSLVLSADGSLVAYLERTSSGVVQAFVQRTNGTAKRAITAETADVSEVTLSGSGNVAYAIGTGGRLLKIDIAGASVTELAKVPPVITRGYIVPGELFSLQRAIFPQDATGVSIGGLTAPVIASDSSTMMFQVPWELEGNKTTEIHITGIQSPFEDATQVQVWPGRPNFFFNLPGGGDSRSYVLAAQEDFSGVVSQQNPAVPGKIVHIFLSGLGMVSPPVATAAITPADTLHRMVARIDCNIDGVWADVSFAGLAPGLIGINQIDVRLPNPLARPGPVIECYVNKAYRDAGSIAAR